MLVPCLLQCATMVLRVPLFVPITYKCSCLSVANWVDPPLVPADASCRSSAPNATEALRRSASYKCLGQRAIRTAHQERSRHKPEHVSVQGVGSRHVASGLIGCHVMPRLVAKTHPAHFLVCHTHSPSHPAFPVIRLPVLEIGRDVAGKW